MEFTSTHLKYLLCMYRICESGEEIRLTEIAKQLRVKKASVARIAQIFREKELVEQKYYGKLHLTALGKETAEQYMHRVDSLADVLIRSGLALTMQ